MIRPTRVAVTTVALAASVLGLTACGGSGGGSSSETTTTGAAASGSGPSGAPGGGQGGGGQNLFSDAKVQACLKAAGISIPTQSAGARPSGSFSRGARPSGSGYPTGARPSGSGFPGGGAGGGLGDSAESQKIQAALKACGITLPTGQARPSGSAAPTAQPSG